MSTNTMMGRNVSAIRDSSGDVAGLSADGLLPYQLSGIHEPAAYAESQALLAQVTGTKVAYQPWSDTQAFIWSQLDDLHWVKNRLVRDATDQRWSVYSRDIIKLLAPYSIHKSPVVAGGGSFTLTSTATTGMPTAHCTRRSGVGTAGEYVELAVPRAGDVYMAYAQRLNGTYAKVTIDGNENHPAAIAAGLPLNGTYRYFDSYGPVDNTRQRLVKIASNVAAGTVVRVTGTSDFSTGSGANGLTLECFLIPCQPGDTNWQQPAFPLNTAVVQGDEFLGANGAFYCCTVAGTTDAVNEPTHTSGTAVNGTATFQYWAFSAGSWHIFSRETQYASENEYAVRATVNAVLGEFGGATHNNETVTAISTLINGRAVAGTIYAPDIGTEIVISETITAVHAEAANLAKIDLVRTFAPGIYDVAATIRWQANATIGWMYGAMNVCIPWEGTRAKSAWQTCRFTGGNVINFSTYASQADPAVSGGSVYGATLSGAFEYQNGLTEAVSNHIMCGLQSVNRYASGAEAWLSANANTAAGSGATTWQAKLYFERDSAADTELVRPGDVWRINNRYVTAMA